MGDASGAASAGVGDLLESLGIGSTNNGRKTDFNDQINPLNQTLGSLFGTLAASLSGQGASQQATSGQRMAEQLDIDDVIEESAAQPIVKAMVQIARADDAIDQEERDALLLDFLEDARPEERQVFENALLDNPSAEDIAKETPTQARKKVYIQALLVGNPDNTQERTFLPELAAALDFDGEAVQALHSGMGKPQISV
ncbi:DUF533 domain-containing protein [Ruegeria atlantica]|uniref:DUF533 domain-containing protein n=1 Tax=Ruegeria atlantica TaxID=81569 RepID=A0AA91BVQ9_9RHOB|nr:DUF533 domain-containing protein [Ruegeria atlantica]NOE20818.1 DUF533 domain-containing protein [Ruegeria atlantica]